MVLILYLDRESFYHSKNLSFSWDEEEKFWSNRSKCELGLRSNYKLVLNSSPSNMAASHERLASRLLE